jgi:hypothetical protein
MIDLPTVRTRLNVSGMPVNGAGKPQVPANCVAGPVRFNGFETPQGADS